MESRRIKWLVLIALLLDVPFIYEFNIHPLFGILTALLVSWLIIEDGYDRFIDLRVSGALLLLVLLWNQLKDLSHLIQATATFVGFTLVFYIIRLVFTKFIPMEKYIEERGDNKEDTPFDYIDTLQEGANVGLMPLMGLAAFLVLAIDMVFNPVQILSDLARDGSSWAGAVWHLHLSMVQVGIALGTNKALLMGILCGLAALLAVLTGLTYWKTTKKNLMPLYPCGAGDPLVIGIFAAMVGAECFYLAVMLLTLLLGIMAHGYKVARYSWSKREQDAV